MTGRGETLLNVSDLKVHFPIHGGVLHRRQGTVYAVDGISFSIAAGETLGLVGESGCGKTTTGRAIMRLYEPTAGRVELNGVDLAAIKGRTLRHTRRQLQIIFQDPFESLNPRHTVGHIIQEPLNIHSIGTGRERRRDVAYLLDRVGLPQTAADKFPHEFSGGQRQRIGIARAIALRPQLIICDEPVSALDVSIQSQVLNLLLELQAELQLSYLFIAHGLPVVKHMSDRVAVMYLGKIVELTDAGRIYSQPRHPYTQSLLAAIPVPDPAARRRHAPLKGEMPSPINPPSGCAFHPRCPLAQDICRREAPALVQKGAAGAHLVACHFASDAG